MLKFLVQGSAADIYAEKYEFVDVASRLDVAAGLCRNAPGTEMRNTSPSGSNMQSRDVCVCSTVCEGIWGAFSGRRSEEFSEEKMRVFIHTIACGCQQLAVYTQSRHLEGWDLT